MNRVSSSLRRTLTALTALPAGALGLLAWTAVLLAQPLDLEAQTLDSPSLAAKVLRRNRGVEVSIKLPRSLQGSRIRRTLSVVLTRDDGSGYAAIAMFNRPGKSIRFRDARATAGSFVYRAGVLNAAGAAGWSVPVAVTISAPSPPPPPPPAAVDCHDVPLPAGVFECPAGYEEEVLRQVNVARQSQGVAPLTSNRQLNCSARNHTAWMIQNNFFAHDGWIEFIRAAGYTGGALGENIAIGYPVPAAVMTGWLGSSGHRANILNGGFNDVGVACLTGAQGVPWWTQNFGSR